ncbi:thermonuclease family protein [Geminicoccus roseus]|uniref:thermonuclease family protein n=1 Tax=Geminicoccus roseus TaxID=404900 RepID=UPI0004037DB3|nr:thermonuclease family protein [Geminicoccus roseus]
MEAKPHLHPGAADLRIFLALLLCLFSMPAWSWPAHVERVIDGDTVRVLRDGQIITVRLAGIDAPERDQPGGHAARVALRVMVEGREVDVRPTERDRYGRLVARLEVQGRDVGQQLVQAGHAWQFTRYDRSAALREAENYARSRGLGLWSAPAPKAPWLWRAGEQPRSATAERSGCSPAPRCSQLTSCAAAMEVVSRCGVGGMDGDGDGIPCEALCRPTG